MDNEINILIEKLNKGELILMKADDTWSIICDAENNKAIEKLLSIKNNELDNPYVLLLDSENQINKYVKEVPVIVWDVLSVADKPLTIIYPQGINVSEKILQKDRSIAIRIVKQGFCSLLIRKYRKPILATWVCINKESIPLKFNKIDKNIITKINYIFKRKEDDNYSKPAGILKFELNSEVKVLRI